MMHLRMRIDLRCPKHPRFNPKNGTGAVRAGCCYCESLCAIQSAVDRVQEMVRNHDGILPGTPTKMSSQEAIKRLENGQV